MDDYYDLGPYGRKVSTESEEAQRWFDRGLNWLYLLQPGRCAALLSERGGRGPGLRDGLVGALLRAGTVLQLGLGEV